ncbi:MAG: ABC transporter permease [Staphylococcus epidermidis]|nr:ABC transporter permease [Staphylococcus epidermidis]
MMFIIFLMAIMVLFISGLAQGLARENISIFDQIKGNQFVVQKMKEPQLEKSILSQSKQDNISKIIDEKPFKMAGKTFKINGNEENVMAINSVKNHQPNLKSGHYPKNENQIAINEKLTAEGLYLDDKVKVKGDDTTYKVVGILKNTMYSHSNIVMMDQSKIEQSSNVATFYVTNQLSKSDKNKINHIKGVQTAISLYVITAIVLSAFFYVMTIQKTSEIGILKAIGITTKHLLASLIIQISMITFIGVAIAEVVILLISKILPVSMPFHIDMHNIIIVLVVFMIVGLIGTSLSFIKLIKIDPIEAIGGGQ